MSKEKKLHGEMGSEIARTIYKNDIKIEQEQKLGVTGKRSKPLQTKDLKKILGYKSNNTSIYVILRKLVKHKIIKKIGKNKETAYVSVTDYDTKKWRKRFYKLYPQLYRKRTLLLNKIFMDQIKILKNKNYRKKYLDDIETNMIQYLHDYYLKDKPDIILSDVWVENEKLECLEQYPFRLLQSEKERIRLLKRMVKPIVAEFEEKFNKYGDLLCVVQGKDLGPPIKMG